MERTKWTDDLREEMRAGFAALRQELRDEMAGLRAEMAGLRAEMVAMRADMTALQRQMMAIMSAFMVELLGLLGVLIARL